MGVFDSERRADLSKHHFLRMKLDLRGGFATAVSLAYVGASVGDIGAQHISRNIEYYGDVGNFDANFSICVKISFSYSILKINF